MCTAKYTQFETDHGWMGRSGVNIPLFHSNFVVALCLQIQANSRCFPYGQYNMPPITLAHHVTKRTSEPSEANVCPAKRRRTTKSLARKWKGNGGREQKTRAVNVSILLNRFLFWFRCPLTFLHMIHIKKLFIRLEIRLFWRLSDARWPNHIYRCIEQTYTHTHIY